MRIQSGYRRSRALALSVVIAACIIVPQTASAGLLDFLFGGQPPREGAPPQSSSFADPFGLNPQPAPPPAAPAASRSSSAHCVRMCDGRYFPITARGGATPAQMCQSFCPASATKVFFGSHIESAVAASGERYADTENAFVYRKKLSADCTCNGRDPAGLAPVDLTLDTTLRPGDVIATSTGLVAYSGSKVGAQQTAEFTPVANYPGLTSEVRARLGEMKVAPVVADVTDSGSEPVAALVRAQPLPPARRAAVN